jgi:hypothetical protein
MPLVMLCAVAAGCSTSDVCNVNYFKPSSRDADTTKAQALAQNEFLAKQGCPERFSPIVTGKPPAAPEAAAQDPVAAIGRLIGVPR